MLLDLLYAGARTRSFGEFGPSETSRFSRNNPTAISKEMALFGLQQARSVSPVPFCQVSNCIFMLIPL